MGMAQQIPRFDAKAYLAWEAEQAVRHEFVDGEVCATAGAGDAHNRVSLNIAAALKALLRGTPCRTFMNDMKLHVASAEAFFYPDVFVTCDERGRRADADLMKRHARVIFEVLSDGTAGYDRSRKFELYRTIEGLSEVLFVQPDRRQVDPFRHNSANGLWVLHPVSGSDILRLVSLDCDLPLDAVHEDVMPATASELAR